MGLLDFLFKKEEKNPSNISPISINVRFIPLRLNAKMENDIDMVVKIKNNSGSEQLVSFDALLPKNIMIGFDKIGVNKRVEKKLGILKPNQEVEFSITIYANNQTKEGEYPIRIIANTHYLNYNKVINKIKRELKIRVV